MTRDGTRRWWNASMKSQNIKLGASSRLNTEKLNRLEKSQPVWHVHVIFLVIVYAYVWFRSGTCINAVCRWRKYIRNFELQVQRSVFPNFVIRSRPPIMRDSLLFASRKDSFSPKIQRGRRWNIENHERTNVVGATYAILRRLARIQHEFSSFPTT